MLVFKTKSSVLTKTESSVSVLVPPETLFHFHFRFRIKNSVFTFVFISIFPLRFHFPPEKRKVPLHFHPYLQRAPPILSRAVRQNFKFGKPLNQRSWLTSVPTNFSFFPVLLLPLWYAWSLVIMRRCRIFVSRLEVPSHRSWTFFPQIKEWLANQPVVGWLEGQWYPQPTRVQVLVLAFIPGFISGFPAMRVQWEETFPSTTRRLRWLRKSQDDMPAQSLGGAHRGRVCVCAFIGVSVCAYIWALASVLC